MRLDEFSSIPGGKTLPKRKGRGHATGNGKTAGRGHKGQKARAGGGVRPGFEGGQMPLYRRLPKRGFNNTRFATVHAEINIRDLDLFEEGQEVGVEELRGKGLVKKDLDGLVILGSGEINKKLTVKATKFTKTAKEKIEKAGGKAEVI
jgi:large subunit ribosomal protein L15